MVAKVRAELEDWSGDMLLEKVTGEENILRKVACTAITGGKAEAVGTKLKLTFVRWRCISACDDLTVKMLEAEKVREEATQTSKSSDSSGGRTDWTSDHVQVLDLVATGILANLFGCVSCQGVKLARTTTFIGSNNSESASSKV